MEKMKHKEKIDGLFEKSVVVDYKSIERIVGSKYAKLLISNLLKKKIIFKLGKGFYTKHYDISLAVFSFKPAYLGLQCALSHYGLWEQETIPVIVTTKKVRRGLRDILGGNVLIRNIDKRFFFGVNLVKEGSYYYPYSDFEKTVIDLVWFNEKMDLEMLKIIQKNIDFVKFKKYLKVYDQKFQNKMRKLFKVK